MCSEGPSGPTQAGEDAVGDGQGGSSCGHVAAHLRQDDRGARGAQQRALACVQLGFQGIMVVLGCPNSVAGQHVQSH